MIGIRTQKILFKCVSPKAFKSIQYQARIFKEQLNYVHIDLDSNTKKVEHQPNPR